MTDVKHTKQWRFYRTSTGAEVAKQELAALPLPAKAELGALMRRLARGETVFTREVENLGGGLWALRVSVLGDEFRCYYFREGRFQHVLVAAHFVPKKTKKIPSGCWTSSMPDGRTGVGARSTVDIIGPDR